MSIPTTRSEQLVMVIGVIIIIGSFLDWISVNAGSTNGIDSVYGIITLLLGTAIAGSTYFEYFDRFPYWSLIPTGLFVFFIFYLYYESLFPQSGPPYTTMYLPNGITGSTMSWQMGFGLFLILICGGLLIIIGVVNTIRRVSVFS